MESEVYNQEDINALATAFKKFIPVLAGTAGMRGTKFITADVNSVDEANRTCVVTSVLDGEAIQYSDVNLSMERNDGIIEIPAIDSTVLVAKMPDGERYVVKCSDIQKWIGVIDGSNKFEFSSSGWVWNDGTLGGLVKVIELTTKLNNLENLVNDLISKYNSHTHPIPVLVTTCGAGAGTTATGVTTATGTTEPTTLTPTVQSDIENTAVKH